MSLALAVATGCSGLDLATRPAEAEQPGPGLFRASGDGLVRALKNLLRTEDDTTAVDVQTAITMETARLPPAQVADRRRFQEEADVLDQMIAESGRPVPLDSAVLAYLANLSNGQSASTSYLSETQERTVLALCGPTHELVGSLDHPEDEGRRLLRQACFTWLVGDLEKSSGLYYLAGTKGASLPPDAGNAFEAFLHRFETVTGKSLLAHRSRLHQGATAGPAGVAGGAVKSRDRRVLSSSLSAP